MIVNKKTKISHLIKYNKGVIDVIAGINKHFRKLKNPILCKMLASRVTVEGAAQIGKISVEDFLKRLEEYGFSVEYPAPEEQNKKRQHNKKLKMDKKNLVTLDVRPVLESGVDPFEEIMKTLKGMNDEQTLLIINTFEPVPLLNLLKKKGYDYSVERPGEGIVYTYLYKDGAVEKAQEKAVSDINEVEDFEAVKKKWIGKMKEIDVHELEMPMPMVSILQALEQLETGKALFVHHKKLPQYLLPELETRGFKHVEQKIDDANLKMIIYK